MSVCLRKDIAEVLRGQQEVRAACKRRLQMQLSELADRILPMIANLLSAFDNAGKRQGVKVRKPQDRKK